MKILLIRFSSIGDIILCTPIIRCIKQQLNAELHFLTSAKFSTVLCSNPYIDKHQLYEGKFFDTLQSLKDEKYDIIIDLHKSRLSRLFRACLMVKIYSFDKLNAKKWLYVQLKINLLPQKHIVDRYFDALKEINVVNDECGLDYITKDEDLLFLLPSKYNVLVLGATYFTKRIPLSISEKIIAKSAFPIVLLGGKDVMSEGLKLETRPNAINIINQTTLNQAALIMKNATMVYTGDTGLMHMAAALQKPITVLWGNTLPAFGMYPYYGNKSPQKYISKEVMELKCRPCSKLGHNICPKGHFSCMLDQKIE
jgi:ADP-heptose:LPS heptosyltransferase